MYKGWWTGSITQGYLSREIGADGRLWLTHATFLDLYLTLSLMPDMTLTKYSHFHAVRKLLFFFIRVLLYSLNVSYSQNREIWYLQNLKSFKAVKICTRQNKYH